MKICMAVGDFDRGHSGWEKSSRASSVDDRAFHGQPDEAEHQFNA